MANRSNKSVPTITGIAREAGVSHATVSLVLNNRADEMRVNAQTAERVRQIAREMNYTPNHLARGLRGKHTQTVGVLWSLCGPHPSEATARRITLLAQQRGYSASLADSMSEPKIVREALADFARRRVDGVILQIGYTGMLQDNEVTSLLKQFKSVVTTGREKLDQEHDHVLQSSDKAIVQIADQFARTRRKQIALLGDGHSSQTKFGKLRDQLARHGYQQEQLVHIQINYRHGETSAEDIRQILDQADRAGIAYDAIFCTCDELAAATMNWHQMRGTCVPDDVAVVGFNNNSLSGFLSPGLASVARQDEGVATTAVEMFFDRLANPDKAPQRKTIEMQFMCRGSAGPDIRTRKGNA